MAANNNPEGWRQTICMKCENDYMHTYKDNITVYQRKMPPESQLKWMIVFIAVILVIVIVFLGICFCHFNEEKKEQKKRSDILREELAKVEVENKDLSRRHSIHVTKQKEFDDLHEALKIHPDFQDLTGPGAKQRAQTIAMKRADKIGGPDAFAQELQDMSPEEREA